MFIRFFESVRKSFKASLSLNSSWIFNCWRRCDHFHSNYSSPSQFFPLGCPPPQLCPPRKLNSLHSKSNVCCSHTLARIRLSVLYHFMRSGARTSEIETRGAWNRRWNRNHLIFAWSLPIHLSVDWQKSTDRWIGRGESSLFALSLPLSILVTMRDSHAPLKQLRRETRAKKRPWLEMDELGKMSHLVQYSRMCNNRSRNAMRTIFVAHISVYSEKTSRNSLSSA